MRKILLAVCLLTALAFAQTVVEGGGKQTRGYPGHNAELHGDVFTLPRPGTITSVAGEGTDGYWIETDSGTLVRNWDSFQQSYGYALPAGRYRALPNLRDNPKAMTSWVRVTVTCP